MEKKIIAISEIEFAEMVEKAITETILSNPKTLEIIKYPTDAISNFCGDILDKILKSLFSTQYVIGTKGKCRRSGEDAIGGKTQNTFIAYHKNFDLSREEK